MSGQDWLAADLREYEAQQDKAANDTQNINDMLDKFRADSYKRGDSLQARLDEFEIAIEPMWDQLERSPPAKLRRDLEKVINVLYEMILDRQDPKVSETYRDLLAEGVRGV